MPSPFPGMDPYLEGSFWTTVHFSLSAEFVRQLAHRLRPNYLVLPIESFVEEMPESEGAGRPVTLADQPGAATAAPLQLATFTPTPIPHVTIEIRDVANRELVTAIELLSPTNKRGSGREEYLAKRRRILLSTAHLMEIDLLRGGHRVPMKEAFDTTYDLLGYDLAVNYSEPPEVPLKGGAAAWAESLLHTAGLRR